MPELEILFEGFPGRSDRGGLGWCAICLIREGSETILFDTGTYGMRQPLLKALSARGVERTDVTTVILSHCHWDHVLNYPLFPRARVLLHQADLDFALGAEPGEHLYLVEWLMEKLAADPRLVTFRGEFEVCPGLKLIETPGHSPGAVSAVLEWQGKRTVVAGDALKYRVDLLSKTVDETHADPARSVESMRLIESIAEIVIPGHDRPFRLSEGEARYLGELKAEFYIKASPIPGEVLTFAIRSQ